MFLISKLARKFKGLLLLPDRIDRLEGELQSIKPILANLLFELRERIPSPEIREARIFSQFGEDGLIHDVLSRASINSDNQRFVEIGVEDYSEANTRLLLTVMNWQGLVIDSQAPSIKKIESSDLSWRFGLACINAQVTRENINDLIQKSGFDKNLGLLSLDIDGNDYWVWESLECCEPDIVVIEYNSLFGSRHAVVVPYDPNFDRTTAHTSWVYWGASIKALAILGEKKGYQLVAANQAGNNLIFVKKSSIGKLQARTAEELYRQPAFRESRTSDGNFSKLAPFEALKEIGTMPVVNVITGATNPLSSLEIFTNP